jgi:hypothetical protein
MVTVTPSSAVGALLPVKSAAVQGRVVEESFDP